MQNTSIKKNELEGIIDCVDSDFLIVKNSEKNIVHRRSKDLSICNSYDNKFRVAPVYYDKFGVLYRILRPRDEGCLYLNLAKNELETLPQLDVGRALSFYKNDSIVLYCDAVSELVLLNEIGEWNFKKIYQCSFTSNEPLVNDGLIVHIGFGGELACFDFQGNTVWQTHLNKVCPQLLDPNSDSGRASIKQPTHNFEEKAIFHVDPYRLVCISMVDGHYLWDIDDAVDFNWCIGHGGEIYSVRSGMLKIISSQDGTLLSEKEIDCDWIQAEKIGLNLFQVNFTDTHLICGFLGHGLCAINLATAKVDWHDFDSMTCNRTPIIKNNRIYAQMKGGIELGSGGVQEYVLEGIGGYLDCPDNQFKFN